jgi:putative salt-induced outer membrane protein
MRDMYDKKMHMLPALALLLAASAAHAEWKGKGEAGIVFARGNTQTDTINLKLGMSTTVDKWKHELGLAALRASTDGTKTADRYLATWQSDYNFSSRAFWFGGLRYENDKFSGFKYSASATSGLGYKFIDTEKVKLAGQFGVGFRRIETESTPTTPGTTSNNAIATAGLNYENQLTATTKLVDKLTAEFGSDNTLLTNFIGVEVKMSTALALAVGLDARYNSKPPAPLKKTDTLTTVNLVYAF